VPVAGEETAKRLVDEKAWPSNQMIDFAIRQVPSKGRQAEE
jgi:hypothetical protein